MKETEIKKQKALPGPGAYNNMKEMSTMQQYAKSMLGGSTLKKELKDNGVPGPNAYSQNPMHKIPGFVIKQDSSKVKKDDDKNKAGDKKLSDETYPNDEWQQKPKGTSIGRSERLDLIRAVNMPGPGKYSIQGDFDKGKEKPKFHMGIKTQGFSGKNMDMPGPGEYETDVIPIHHSNVAHFIGTSVRSDLGVGKAYMYPGPGEYEAQPDMQMDPRMKIAGTFGTDKKDTVIKKTFAPGPGSYDLPASVGLMPKYLRTEENRALKEAETAQLRARLEI